MSKFERIRDSVYFWPGVQLLLILIFIFLIGIIYTILSPNIDHIMDSSELILSGFYLVFGIMFLPTLLILGIIGPFVTEIIFIISSIIVGIINLYLIFKFTKIFFTNKKARKISFIVIAIVLFFVVSLDSIVLNNSINKPDLSCSDNSECIYKLSNLGQYKCVNSEWKKYNGLINKVFADQFLPDFGACSCEKNVCVTEVYSRSEILNEFDSIDDCNIFYASQDLCVKLYISENNVSIYECAQLESETLQEICKTEIELKYYR